MRTERPLACLECNTRFGVFPPEVAAAISDGAGPSGSAELDQLAEEDGTRYVLADRQGVFTCPGCGARFVMRGIFLDTS